MLCESCNVDIPPAWVKIIQSNVCPQCEGEIMSSSSKELLTNLQEAIGKMAADPEGLAGWLMSTYQMTPKGSVVPTQFYGKQAQAGFAPPGAAMVNPALAAAMAASGAGAPGGLKVANSATKQFLQRAGVDKIINNPKAAAVQQMIQQINANVAEDPYGSEPSGEITEEERQDELEAIQEMAAAAAASGKKVTASQLLANNTSFFDNSGTISQAEIAALKNIVEGETTSTAMADLENHPALQADRMKRLSKQRELSLGGGGGGRYSIRRSE